MNPATYESALSLPRGNRVAVYSAMLLILVYLGRVQELFPSLNGMSLGKIVFFIAIAAYFFSPKRYSVRLTAIPQARYVFALCIVAIFSVPFSVWPGQSLQFLISDYGKLILFFFLMIKSVDSLMSMGFLVWAIAISAFLLGICTMALEKVGRLSVSSTYDPNDLAFVMIAFLPLVYFMAKTKTGPQKAFLLITMAIMVITTFYTVSRGGFLGLIVVALAMAFRQGKKFGNIVILSVIFSLLFSLFAPTSYWERMATLLEPEKDYNMMEGNAGRIEVWKNGLSLMMQRPLSGVGIGCFETAEGLAHGGLGKWSAAHNSFVQIGAELGIGGLVLFCLLIVRSFQKLKKLRMSSANSDFLWLINGVEIGLYGYITAGFFLSQAYSPVIYLLLGMVIILAEFCPSEVRDFSEQRVSS